LSLKKLTGVLSASAAFAFCAGAVSAAPTSDIVAEVPQAPAVVDLGHAPPSTRIDIALTLNYRNEATLERLVAEQADPTSPLHGQYLTNQQFNAYFAPTPADYARVAAVLQKNGFRVTQTFDNQTVIDAQGTAAAANRLFSTDIHLVNQAGQGVRYANATPGHEPAALRGLIGAITGLHTLTLDHINIAVAKPNPDKIQPYAAGPPLKGPVSSVTHLAGFGPLAFSQGYLFPEQFKNSGGKYYDGTGRTSGVVIDADFLDSDLAAFLAYFNVKRTGPTTVRVKVDGGPPSGNGSPDSLETALDVETIVSNAPGTALYVYEFPSFQSDKYITDAYNKVASDNLVDTANSSFGGCETQQKSAAKSWDKIALQASSKGITFHASSGDSGSNECNGGGVSAPASGPHFAAIGGTTLAVQSNGTWSSETAWSGSGGGVSKVFALPTWQKGVKNIITTGRNVPDVAFDANPQTGAAYYYGGSWNTPYNPLGGTSLSSPLFGAAVTEVDQYLGKRSGLEAVALYAELASKGYNKGSTFYFHDITSGGNGGFETKPGYDQVTGIGSAVWYDILTK
jgi:kumamolisin